MWTPEVVLPHLEGVAVEQVERSDGLLLLAGRCEIAEALCPKCGLASSRVHSRYLRTVRDLPVGGGRLVLQLQVRRFRCANERCPAVTFVEQIPGLTRAYGRYTAAAETLLGAVGLALAGRAGARLAARLGLAAGRDTLLRRVRALPEQPIGHVTVLGVDDFAFRRGHRYGTVMVDLSTHRPVDMIDGRDGETFATWLRAQPGTQVICRDRAGGYAEGARAGAPSAIQVADRFHLWQNLGQAVEKTVNTLRANLATPSPAAAPPVLQPPHDKKIITRLRRDYEAVQELYQQGWSKAAIGRKLQLHQATVRKFANARSVEDVLAKNQQRASIVDEHVEYLHQRWNEGERNATQLFREIKARGYQGGELAVQRYLRRYRHTSGPAPKPGPRPPSVRDVTSWIMTDPDHLPTDDTEILKAITRRDADLHRLAGHVRTFATMMVKLQGDRLDDWIITVEADRLAPLASFARNLRRDIDAVRNGLTLPYSSGPVEGRINRIKMLKRQMFGRANIDLLRKRTLLAR